MCELEENSKLMHFLFVKNGRSINGVLSSLEKMKNTLQESLKKQWDMETQREQQLRALSHDIKTPLTIIRGNAELMAEIPIMPFIPLLMPMDIII